MHPTYLPLSTNFSLAFSCSLPLSLSSLCLISLSLSVSFLSLSISLSQTKTARASWLEGKFGLLGRYQKERGGTERTRPCNSSSQQSASQLASSRTKHRGICHVAPGSISMVSCWVLLHTSYMKHLPCCTRLHLHGGVLGVVAFIIHEASAMLHQAPSPWWRVGWLLLRTSYMKHLPCCSRLNLHGGVLGVVAYMVHGA